MPHIYWSGNQSKEIILNKVLLSIHLVKMFPPFSVETNSSVLGSWSAQGNTPSWKEPQRWLLDICFRVVACFYKLWRVSSKRDNQSSFLKANFSCANRGYSKARTRKGNWGRKGERKGLFIVAFGGGGFCCFFIQKSVYINPNWVTIRVELIEFLLNEIELYLLYINPNWVMTYSEFISFLGWGVDLKSCKSWRRMRFGKQLGIKSTIKNFLYLVI